MKKLVLLVFISMLTVVQAVMLPENTVAVVNGIAISNDELDIAVDKLLPKQSYHSSVKREKTKEIEKKALDSLVDLTIFYSYALSEGIKADEEVLEEFRKKLLSGAGGSKVKLAILLQRLKLTEEMVISTYKRQIIVQKLYLKYIQTIPTDKELKKYYEKNKYKFKRPEKIHAMMIYVKNEPTDPQGAIKSKKRATEALKKIKDGAKFEVVAEEYSDAMSRVKGGDLGFLHKGQLNAYIEKEAFAMKEGELSDIIEKSVGCYIVKVIAKAAPEQMTFEQVKKKLSRDLQKKEEKIKRDNLLAKLKKTAKIIR